MQARGRLGATAEPDIPRTDVFYDLSLTLVKSAGQTARPALLLLGASVDIPDTHIRISLVGIHDPMLLDTAPVLP